MRFGIKDSFICTFLGTLVLTSAFLVMSCSKTDTAKAFSGKNRLDFSSIKENVQNAEQPSVLNEGSLKTFPETTNSDLTSLNEKSLNKPSLIQTVKAEPQIIVSSPLNIWGAPTISAFPTYTTYTTYYPPAWVSPYPVFAPNVFVRPPYFVPGQPVRNMIRAAALPY